MTLRGLTHNVASYLPHMAANHGDTVAVYFPVGKGGNGQIKYESCTYHALNEESDLLAKGLAEMGVSRGTRVVLMVKPSLDFFTLVFAIFKVGATMVCVDPGMGAENLGVCLGQAKPEVFIGIAKAHAARKILGWAKKTIRQNVMVGESVFFRKIKNLSEVKSLGTKSKYEIDYQTDSDQVPAILFTSGSTGIPKGVIYSHQNFMAQVTALRDTYGITPGEVDLATFPLFALYAPVLGMTAVIPQMDFTKPGRVKPENILEPIKQFGVNNLFGSPALLNCVGQVVQSQQIKLPSLKRVLSAGAPVPARVMRLFENSLKPGVFIHTPYGATESLPVASASSREVLGNTEIATANGEGVCVGHVVGQAEVKIIQITDAPICKWDQSLELPRGEIGEIIVQGPCVTAGYDQMPEQTKLAKIENEKSFYHRMGDLGYFDQQGRLWFCGRKSQRVITAKKVYYSVACEGVFNAHAAVFRSALVKLSRKQKIMPGICLELSRKVSKYERKKIVKEIRIIAAENPITQGIDHVFFHASFPVDIRHNAKINREMLSRWAQRKLR